MRSVARRRDWGFSQNSPRVFEIQKKRAGREAGVRANLFKKISFGFEIFFGSDNYGLDLEIDINIFKTLKRMPRRDTEAILKIIRLLPANPYLGDIQKMRGEDNIWRLRIGSYRIFYKIKIAGKVILVFNLERKISKTY